MTIDEAIAHAREVAEIQRKDNENCKYKAEYGCKGCADYYSKPCIECAEEHEQLAEWLEELKAYREIGTVEECRNSILDIEMAYNKAIDDLMKKVSECFISDADWNYLLQGSKRLKEGGVNGNL